MVFSLPLKLLFVPLYYRGEAGASAPHLPFKKKVINIGHIVMVIIWPSQKLSVSLS